MLFIIRKENHKYCGKIIFIFSQRKSFKVTLHILTSLIFVKTPQSLLNIRYLVLKVFMLVITIWNIVTPRNTPGIRLREVIHFIY